MRWSRPRFSVRGVLVAVACIACVIGVEAMRRRSVHFRELAEFHEGEVYGIEDEIPPDPENRWETNWFLDDATRRPFYPAGRFSPSDDEPPVIAAWRRSQARRIAYHERLSRTYRRAVTRPWAAVAPDPRKPD